MLVRVCGSDTDVARLQRFELLLGTEFVGHGVVGLCVGGRMVERAKLVRERRANTYR